MLRKKSSSAFSLRCCRRPTSEADHSNVRGLVCGRHHLLSPSYIAQACRIGGGRGEGRCEGAVEVVSWTAFGLTERQPAMTCARCLTRCAPEQGWNWPAFTNCIRTHPQKPAEVTRPIAGRTTGTRGIGIIVEHLHDTPERYSCQYITLIRLAIYRFRSCASTRLAPPTRSGPAIYQTRCPGSHRGCPACPIGRPAGQQHQHLRQHPVPQY